MKGFILFLLLLSFSNCDVSRSKTDGLNNNCKVFLECMYLNRKNKDKSICISLSDGCKQANDFLLCSENIKIDFKDCLLLLKK